VIERKSPGNGDRNVRGESPTCDSIRGGEHEKKEEKEN